VRALQEIGIDTSALWSKPISEYLGKKAFRFVIVVCEEAERSCPRLYPFMGVRLSWPFEDPAAAEGSEEERLAVFRRVRDALDERITAWLASPASCATEASRASRG
jgi:arsenate reductase